MTVKELIQLLQKEDPDALVVLQKDGEGNGFSPLADLWDAAYREDTTWSGGVGIKELTDAHARGGYTEEDVLEGAVDALILCPVN